MSNVCVGDNFRITEPPGTSPQIYGLVSYEVKTPACQYIGLPFLSLEELSYRFVIPTLFQ